jgi:type VI secretion system ImpA family protein
MATPPTIDVRAILDGTPPPPSGDRDPAHAQLTFDFRQFYRRADGAPGDGGAEAGARAAEVARLIMQSTRCLTDTARDLVVASWLADVLVEAHGFAGLRDGLNLVGGLVAECWDDCLPRVGPDGDAEARARPLEALATNRFLLQSLRRVALSDPATGAPPLFLSDALKGRAVGNGPLPAEEAFVTGDAAQAVGLTPRPYYEGLADDLRDAARAAATLAERVNERMGDQAPDLSPVGQALDDCRHVLDLILAVKRRQERGPGPAARPAAPAAALATAAAPAAPAPADPESDVGQALIAFHDRARALAKAAARLKENREKRAELLKQIRDLDDEYQAIAAEVAGDPDFGPLLAGRLGRDGQGTESVERPESETSVAIHGDVS